MSQKLEILPQNGSGVHQRVKYFREKDEFFLVVKKILINFVLSIWTALRCIVPCWVYMCRGFGGENGEPKMWFVC